MGNDDRTRKGAAVTDPVLICGGGIGGLSAAIALARQGIPVKVLEQAKSFSEAGAGIELGPNAARHLSDWGLMELLSSFASEPQAMRIHDGADRAVLATVPIGAYMRERYGAPYLIIHRKQLQYCLLEAAGRLDGVDIETGFKVARIEASEEGVVATTRSGKPARGRVLVGADGLWSSVRATLSDAEPVPAGVTAWRALVPAETVPSFVAPDDIGLYLGPGAHVVHYPIDGGATMNLVAMIEETLHFDGWASPGEASDLLPFFSDWSDDVYGLLELPESWHKWTVMRMDPLQSWGEGPVTLIGDAAHPIEPFMAQGGATAIEDAAELGNALAAQPDNAVAALRSYEAARQARARRIQVASHERGVIYHRSGPMRWIRNLALRHGAPVRFVKRYDWLYGATQ